MLPEFTPPYVEIQTEALGLSADEVEQLITVPLEADLLNGVAGVETIRSESLPGLSSIVMVFAPGTDVFEGRQLVQERLTQAHALPNVSRPPTMLQPLSSSSRVMMIGLDPGRLSAIDASVLARWTVRPRLMGVAGVANVSIWGQRDQQLQVQVDPERLRDRDVTLNQVVETTGNAQLVSPLSFLEASTPGTGGFVETPTQRLQVRHVFEKLSKPKALSKVPVEGTGGKLRLTDVAKVAEDRQPLIGDAVVNGRDGMMLVVEKFPGASTTQVTEDVEEALEQLRPGLSGTRFDSNVFRPATFIEDAAANVRLTLAVAGVLTALALAALLFEWRTALVALVTIPLSLVAATLVLVLLGQPMNAIAFAGLAVAVVLVVDDAVIGAENVSRRFRRRRAERGEGSPAAIVLEATAEIRSPAAYATLIVLLAVVPVLALGGRPGAFFEPLAIAYLLALVASMVVALTVTPALSLLLLSRARHENSPSPILRRLLPGYDAALGRFVRSPRAALLLAGICVLAGLATLPLFETSLIPTFKDRDMIVRLKGPPGTSEPKMSRMTAQAAAELGSIPGVAQVGAHVGRAITGDRRVDVDSSELWVSIDSDADYDTTATAIDTRVDGLRAVGADVVTYSEQQVRDVGGLVQGEETTGGRGLDALTGTGAPLVVRVYGQDPETLRREAQEVSRTLAGVAGVVGPHTDSPGLKPAVEIEVDLAKARRYGIKPGDVRRAEATLLQGIQVGSTFEQQKVFDVIVQGAPDIRESVSGVRRLLIDRPGGGHVRVGDVADVRVRPAANVIRRDAVSRYVDVQAGVTGRSVKAVAGDVEDRLADMTSPLEYHAEVKTKSASQEAGGARVLALAIAAAIGSFLLLQACFQSWRLATLTFLTLPPAMAGGLLAALVDGATLSLGSLAGFLALLGIAARNGALLVRHLQRLREAGEPLGAGLVERGARDRLAPLLATTFALAGLALPFVVLGSRPGLEIVHPMAVVLLGGLITSTLLYLLVLPALYLRFAPIAPPGRADYESVEAEDGVETSAPDAGEAAGARPLPARETTAG